MKNRISSKDLVDVAHNTSEKAVNNAKAMKIAYTVQEGRNIVKHFPDGTKASVGKLDKAYVKPKVKQYSL